jgi:hypothetical protein
VSYLLLPHARRVASPLWVLDRRRLRRLHRCGIAAAPRCAPGSDDRSGVRRAVAGRAGHALRTRAAPRVVVGRAPAWPWVMHALCMWAEPTLRAWAKRHCATGPSVVSAQ